MRRNRHGVQIITSRMPGCHVVVHLYHVVVRKCGAGVTDTDFNIFNLGYVNKRKQNRLATS